jgi:transposase
VLPPWLKQALRAILAALPEVTLPEAERPALARWATGLGQEPLEPLPPLRRRLIGDNLAGHQSPALVRWSREHGILPVYTPLAGSWLNLAEALRRIRVGRAPAGQHPRTAAELIRWLEEAVAGWNRAPTPLVWGGKRRERRQRARQRRLGGAAAALAELQPIAA